MEKSEYSILKKSYFIKGIQFWADLHMHNCSGRVTVHLSDELRSSLPDTQYLEYKIKAGAGPDATQLDTDIRNLLEHYVERIQGWPTVKERLEEEGWDQA
jgi:hypothetical protein